MMKNISLSQGKMAFVDEQDVDFLNQWKWTYRAGKGTGYAYRKERQKDVYMHRAILDPPLDMEVDHINGNGIDNRRCNLRICTHKENGRNQHKRMLTTSRYQGVCWNERLHYWVARIVKDGLDYWLGCFESEEEAAIAYNQKAVILHGKFASLNPVSDRSPVLPPPRKQANKTSSYVGVSWSPKPQCWRAEIRVNYKLIFLGHFDSEEDAARAWNMAALQYRGVRARLNDVDTTSQNHIIVSMSK